MYLLFSQPAILVLWVCNVLMTPSLIWYNDIWIVTSFICYYMYKYLDPNKHRFYKDRNSVCLVYKRKHVHCEVTSYVLSTSFAMMYSVTKFKLYFDDEYCIVLIGILFRNICKALKNTTYNL